MINSKPDSDTDKWTIIIRASKGWVSLQLAELIRYRELMLFLCWRNISVRYRQSFLGVGWAIIQPFSTMVVFSIFFGTLAKIPSNGVPYPVFSFVGLLPWTFFSNAVSQSSGSLVGQSYLITKVYFPRLIIPISTVLSGLVDFCIAFVILIGMMIFYGITPTPAVLMTPVFLLLAFVSALGVGLWLSALNIEYRDIQYIVPFLVQTLMFISPVVYASSYLSEPWRTLYGLNPMVGVLEGFRWALLNAPVPGPMIAVSACIAVLLFVSGAFYFRRMEKSFADVV